MFLACACDPPAPPGSSATDGSTDTSTTTSGSTVTGDAPTTSGSSSEVTGDPAPTQANIIFVTSTIHDGDLGGVAGADAECNARAAAAGLPGEYIAWLSTPEFDAITRIAGSRGWIRPDGRPFADTLAQDIRPNWYPPALDEFGAVVPDGTVTITGTNYKGAFFDKLGTCADYTATMAAQGVATGDPFSGAGNWSSGGASVCSVPMRLFCLGIGLDVPLALPPPQGRLAFVSKDAVLTGGIAAADAQCQAEADAGGLSGGFRALLASTGGSAASRFDLDGPTWFRLDGAQLFETAADLATGRPLAPLMQQATGLFAASLVRLGAPTPGSPATDACDDWTSTSGETPGGASRFIGALAYGGKSRACGDALAHYCFQE